MAGLLEAVAGLLIAMNPFGNVVFFLEAVAHMERGRRLLAALETGVAAGLVAALTALAGRWLMGLYGVGPREVALAGGLVLAAVALKRLLSGAGSVEPGGHLFPVAAPLIAGPATVSYALAASASLGPLAALAALVSGLAVAAVLALAALYAVPRRAVEAASRYTALLTMLVAVKMLDSASRLALAPG